MQSHIRIGTFEFIRYYHDAKDLAMFTDYVINRLSEVEGLLNNRGAAAKLH